MSSIIPQKEYDMDTVPGRPRWILSGGQPVTAEAAAILIRDARVVPADAALFPDLSGQEWRFTND
jgi:hypothetical protein